MTKTRVKYIGSCLKDDLNSEFETVVNGCLKMMDGKFVVKDIKFISVSHHRVTVFAIYED
ncbi:hypothetical protein [Macrococcoides canis]|uniref:hypothetical protein n=1 Tax=Macrococcoides canis TaxID=1855823 RepID=UPI0020B6579D|nr:hypothetical protein [Macrococcus canis]UTH07942.1 hypothetical protein KFV07_05885 [Macrococcus canis]